MRCPISKGLDRLILRCALVLSIGVGVISGCYKETRPEVPPSPPLPSWARRIGGAGSEMGGKVIVTDTGNIYVSGSFENIVDFAEDFECAPDIKSSRGMMDVFLTRIGFDGGYCWTRRIGGTQSDLGCAFGADGFDNIYLAGVFEGTVDFREDWGDGADSKSSNGGYDAFITRINADGSYGWTRRIGAGSDVRIRDVHVEGSGELTVTGTFEGTVDFEADWGGGDPRTPVGSVDAFVVRIGGDGSYGWTRTFGGTGSLHSNGIARDGAGNVYVGGEFDGIVDFRADWGAGTDTRTTTIARATFVCKVNWDGSYGWTRVFSGTGAVQGGRLAVESTGEVYISGVFGGTANFAADWGGVDSKSAVSLSFDAFVTRINADGSYGWTRRIGGTGQTAITRLKTNGYGSVYVVGMFNLTVDFAADWGASDVKSTVDSCFDPFVMRILEDGSYCWSRVANGPNHDYGGSIAVDGSVK